MGGGESEVTTATRSVLLESAAWNMMNIRKTAKAQNLPSEASYRFHGVSTLPCASADYAGRWNGWQIGPAARWQRGWWIITPPPKAGNR